MAVSRTQGLRLRKYKRIDESPQHLKGKLRLCKLFRNYGFKAQVERPMHCYVELGDFTVKYAVDVYASKGSRQIIAEVDGFLGHKTKLAKTLQDLRLRRIRETYGREIEEYRFTLRRLAKWTNQEIAEEMRLSTTTNKSTEAHLK